MILAFPFKQRILTIHDIYHFKKFKGIKNLQTVNLSFKAADDLNFFSESEFSDPEKADLFKDAVKGFISAVKFSLSDDRETVDILSKVDVETKTNTLLINFQMTKADIEKLTKQVARFEYTSNKITANIPST